MSAAVTAIAARLFLLFTPVVQTSVFVFGVAWFLALFVLLCAALTTFVVIAFSAGRRTQFRSAANDTATHHIVFNELELLTPLILIGSQVVNAFQQFFGQITAAARSIVEFIIFNPRRIIALILISGFVAVFLISPELIFPVLSQAYNCFVGPLVRIIVLPLSSIAAFFASVALPFANFVSRFSKTATTSAILHAVVGAAEQVTVSLMLLGSAVLQFGIAQKAWMNQPTPIGQAPQLLVVGPDFNVTAHLLGDAVYNLRFVTQQACSPLQPYVFEPLLKPFDDEEFAAAVNNTLNLLYVPLTQGVLRPIAQYIVNLDADPGGSFGDLSPIPSLNSTIDTLNFAQRNWTRFLDSFVPSIIDGINVLLQDITGLPLPDTTFPRRGPLTIFVSFPLDILLRTAKLTQNLIFQLIFNPDVALVFPDGIAIWKIDEILDGILEYTAVINDYTDFISDYLRDLGANFEAELTNPLSHEHVNRMLPANEESEFILLLTEGQLINSALQFVANIIDSIPCIITAIAEAIVTVLKLANDLIVGTIYSFMHAAFGGRVANPLEFAQTLFRGGPVDNVRCTVGSTVLFTVPHLGPCPDYFDAFDRCLRPVLNVTTMQFQMPLPLYPSWVLASQTNINNAGNDCGTCSRALVFGTNFTTIPNPSLTTNRYAKALEEVMEPLGCLLTFLSRLCVGVSCPVSAATSNALIPFLRDIFLLPINLFVHLDKIGTTTYLVRDVCFPIQTLPGNILGVEITLTNAVRRVLNAVLTLAPVSTSCGDANSGGAPPSSFLPCCLLNLFDSVIGFTSETITQLIVQTQLLIKSFLPLAAGGFASTSYTPPPFFFSTGWLLTGSQALACVPVQLIPPTLTCQASMLNAKSTIQTKLGNILNGFVTLVPTLVVNAINGILNIILNPSLGAVRTLLVNITTPVINVVGTIFLNFADMLICLDSGNPFALGLINIGAFLQSSLALAVGLFIDLVFAVLQLVVGIFALFTGNVLILLMSLTSFVNFLIGIIIALFGQPLVCGTQDALCFVGVPIDPVIRACNNGVGSIGNNDYGFSFCSNAIFKRSADVDCFRFLADYGWERARDLKHQQTAEEELAAGCFKKANEPGALFEFAMRQQKMQNEFIRLLANAPAMIEKHLTDTATYIQEESSKLHKQQKSAQIVRQQSVESLPQVDLGLFYQAFSAKLGGDTSKVEQFGAYVASQRSSIDQDLEVLNLNLPTHDSYFVQLAAALRHADDVRGLSISLPHHHAPIAHQKRSVDANDRLTVAIGGRLVRERLQTGYNNAVSKITETMHSMLDRAVVPKVPQNNQALLAAQRIDAGEITYSFNYANSRGYTSLVQWSNSGDLVAPLAIEVNPDVLPALGLPDCDEMNQILCTECKYVDDLILVSEKSVRTAQTFYTAPGVARGTFGYITDTLDKALTDVLVDPAGTDTYSTEPRSTLFITTRLWEIRWAWQFDYSEFLDIISNSSVVCDTSDPLADIDIDQGFKDAFNELFGDLAIVAQQFICRVVVAPAETASRFVERYIMCDYDEALYGLGNKGTQSIDGPQQLLDGFANSVLILALLGLIVESIPGTSMTFTMIAPFILYFGTLWIGYGSSIFCTLPGPMQLLGAYPITLPLDAYGLLESTLAPSTPFPFALIDPAFQEHFSTVKITTCGDTPPVVNCAEAAGFDGIYDNIFYSTGVLFGDDFNTAAANTIGLFSDSIQQAALEFNSTHIAELEANHNVGDVCNRLTFVRIVFGLFGLAANLIKGIATITFLIPFIAFMVLLTVGVLMLTDKVSSQTNAHYVEDARVDDNITETESTSTMR